MWKAETYYIAKPDGLHKVDGFTNGAGLGLHLIHLPNVHGFLRPEWILTHLNSGHSVANIYGPQQFALEVANEIAAALDWNFKNVQTLPVEKRPALDKVKAIIEKYAPFVGRDMVPQPGDALALAEKIAATRGAK